MYHFVAPPARGGPAHALRDGQRLGHNDRLLHEYLLRLLYRVALPTGLIKRGRARHGDIKRLSNGHDGALAHALRDGQRLGHNDRLLHEYSVRLFHRVALSIGPIKREYMCHGDVKRLVNGLSAILAHGPQHQYLSRLLHRWQLNTRSPKHGYEQVPWLRPCTRLRHPHGLGHHQRLRKRPPHGQWQLTKASPPPPLPKPANILASCTRKGPPRIRPPH